MRFKLSVEVRLKEPALSPRIALALDSTEERGTDSQGDYDALEVICLSAASPAGNRETWLHLRQGVSANLDCDRGWRFYPTWVTASCELCPALRVQ